jgi:hypothetical protein
MPITRRLEEKIKQDFPEDHDAICSMLHEVENKVFGGDGNERILAAVILSSKGSTSRFFVALSVLEEDWRDVLMEAGLGHDDWPLKLEEYLNSDTK